MAELSTLARPYAKAAFEHAIAHSTLASWSDALETCAAVVANERVATVLDNPALTGEQQAATVNNLCGEETSDEVKNFVSILAENRRLALLPNIVEQFELFKANQEKSVDVEVVSAFDLHEALTERLERKLRDRLERDVNVTTSKDESLLGGVLIRAGDTVIDGSVRGRLNKLAEAMNS